MIHMMGHDGILLTGMLLLLAGCSLAPARETRFDLTVLTHDLIAVGDQKFSAPELTTFMKKGRYQPDATVFVFYCAKATRHWDLLRFQRCLSTLGYYRFALGSASLNVQVFFGCVEGLPPGQEPEKVMKISITPTDVGTDGHRTRITDGGIGTDWLLARGGPDVVDAEITCDMDSSNAVLEQVVSLLAQHGFIHVYIASI